jgi:serralysin
VSRTKHLIPALAVSVMTVWGGCASESNDSFPTFEEFAASTPRIVETGAFVIDGDIAVTDEAELRPHYDAMRAAWNAAHPADGLGTSEHALALHQNDGVDARWSNAQKGNLTYCISNSFGSDKAALVTATNNAAASWEAAADVDFVYVPAQDSDCDASNNAVVFDIRPTNSDDFAASAFYPGWPRNRRTIWVADNAFNSPTFVMRHELGHVLGFPHEHTRSGVSVRDSGGWCYEDADWRPLTTLDGSSIMHYESCSGSPAGGVTNLSASDRNGAACLYGAAPGFTPSCGYRGIELRAHVRDKGWLPFVRELDVSGTVDEERRLEAFRIRLTGSSAFDVCYSVHVQDHGWMPEVCDGATAGTTGQGKRLEAIKLRLRGAPAGCHIRYQSHVQDNSWMPFVSDGAVSGTTGIAKRLEGLRVDLTGTCF